MLKLKSIPLCLILLVASVSLQAQAQKPAASPKSTSSEQASKLAEAAATGALVGQQSWGHSSSYGIDVDKAWSLVKNKCSEGGVVVAVIDTGIDPKHPDLIDSLWTNPKEASGKEGIDNDGNGFVNDIHGWDFVKHSGSLVDTHGHGTHIAGIIASKAKSASGYNGICPGVKIMSLRYYDAAASGVDNLKNTIRAIEYAVNNGARIINYSGGGAEFSEGEKQALKKAEAKGILVVAAAGNERSNADQNLYYPAAYSLSNLIAVTAVNQEGQVLPSSNWGTQKVQIAAPGNSILSTLPGGSYGFMTGTSQATAFVSGVAALMLSVKPSLTVAELKSKLSESAVHHKQLVGKTQYGAEVNAFAAVNAALGGAKVTAKADSTADRRFAATVSGKASSADKEETSLKVTGGVSQRNSGL